MSDMLKFQGAASNNENKDPEGNTVVKVFEADIDTSKHHLHRKLSPRHLQLITIAGGIGCEC